MGTRWLVLPFVLVLAGCGGAAATTAPPPTAAPSEAAAAATEVPLPTAIEVVTPASTPVPATPAPTPAPSASVPILKLGQVGRAGDTELVVLKAAYATQGQYINPPAGDVWVAFRVKVTAEKGTQTVSVSDFTATADGTEQGQMGFADISAWQPEISISTLAAGRSITGWLVFELPMPKQFVELDYTTDLLGGPPRLTFVSRCCQQ